MMRHQEGEYQIQYLQSAAKLDKPLSKNIFFQASLFRCFTRIVLYPMIKLIEWNHWAHILINACIAVMLGPHIEVVQFFLSIYVSFKLIVIP